MEIKMISPANIEKLSEREQLEFYKKHFQYQHCELDGCGHEVGHMWGMYDGSLYCGGCFDWMVEDEYS
jgi:hypothetical protein